MRRGVRLGVDVGSVRIGVARCDPDGIMATPLTTVTRAQGEGLGQIAGIVHDVNALEVVVGLPRSMDGRKHAAARHATSWAKRLARTIAPTPVRLVDERLSTVSAHQAMGQAGRRSKERRQLVDQAAAVIILDQALEIERASGQAPGELISVGAHS